ncbi:MAG: hypothetical protein EAZ95_20690 [Bacteroidetes bacterium]|nr:MAG: hypothetical protein EAZ95_20690 [Bacteroidota bacterium]
MFCDGQKLMKKQLMQKAVYPQQQSELLTLNTSMKMVLKNVLFHLLGLCSLQGVHTRIFSSYTNGNNSQSLHIGPDNPKGVFFSIGNRAIAYTVRCIKN